MSQVLPFFQGVNNAGAMARQFANNARSSYLGGLQEQQVRINQDKHDQEQYTNNVNAVTAAAIDNGFSKDGRSLDQDALNAAYERKKKGEPTPALDSFAAATANTIFGDQLADLFKFKKLVVTPEGDATLEGEYNDDAGQTAPMTVKGTSEQDDPVAFIPGEKFGGLLSTAYSTIVNHPNYATTNVEVQRKILLDQSVRGSKAQAGRFTSVVLGELSKIAPPEQARALMSQLSGMTPAEQVTYLRDNVVPAMQKKLDDLNLSDEQKESIKQTTPDDSPDSAVGEQDNPPIDSSTATQIEKLNEELQSLGTGRAADRRRMAIRAKIKALGASAEAKQFAEAQDSSETPVEVSEEEESGIMSWVQENPVDAAMLAASGVLLMAGPAGWAIRGGLSAVRATPQAAKWIMGKVAKAPNATARGARAATTKPKYKGKPRNSKGQLTSKGNEARQFSTTKTGLTVGTLAVGSMAVQNMLAENPEMEDADDGAKSLVTKAVNTSKEDIIAGNGPTFTQKELDGFKDFLTSKGVKSMQDAARESVDIQQALRAVLSTTMKHQEQANEMMEKFNNVMETGNPSFDNKSLATFRQEQRKIGNNEHANEISQQNADRLVETENRAMYGEAYETIDTVGEKIQNLMFNEEGEPLDPSQGKIKNTFFGGTGVVKKLLTRMRAQQSRMEKDPSNKAAKEQYKIFKDEALAAISFALQAASAEGSLEWSAATESGAAMSASDRGLSRIGFDPTNGGFIIRKPGTPLQDGDGFTKQQAMRFFGDRETYNFFVKELEKVSKKRGS